MSRLGDLVLSTPDQVSSSPVKFKSLNVQLDAPVEPVYELIVPEKWFCLVGKSKSYQNYGYHDTEIYVNFEWSERVKDAGAELLCGHSGCGHDHAHEELPSTGSTRPGEHHYRIPYLLERTFKSEKMKIFDFVVGRKTLRWARKQDDFFDVLIRSAIEAIEETFGDKIELTTISVAQETDYKIPPQETDHSELSRKATHSSPLIPYIERKLDHLANCERIEPQHTGLTSKQRELLKLNPNVNIQPFDWLEKVYPGSYQDSLKISIPKVVTRQNETSVSIFVDWPVKAENTKWKILEISKRDRKQVNEEHNSTDQNADGKIFGVEIFGIDTSGQEYAVYLELASSVEVRRTYATLSKGVFIVACAKQSRSSVLWSSVTL